MAVRERVEYDVTLTGGRDAERDLARVERALSGLTEEQQANVKASRAFAAAQDNARGKTIAATRADLDLADARARLEKVTKDGKSSELDRAKALNRVEAAEAKAARAARVAAVAHSAAGKEFRRAAAGADEVEKTSTRASRALTRMGTAGRGAGKVTAVGFAGVSKTIGGVRVGLGGVFKGMALGIPIVGALGVGLGTLGAMTYGAATKLDLMERKARTVYQKTYPQVVAWSEKVANRAGLTSREMVGLAASFADMLQPMGFTVEKSAALSQKFAAMAPVLAEWSAGQFSVADTSEALMGALTGEYDTLQRLGIPISDAAVQAELLKRGQDKLTGSAINQAKAAIALDIVYRGSTAAQKNYAEGAGSLAAKQAEATAKFKEVRDAILVAVLPALGKAGTWFLEHQDDIIDWAFHAAAGMVTFGERTGLAFADVIEWVGRGMVFVGKFVASMIGGFATAGHASTALGALLGVGLSPQAKKAGEALDRMAETAGTGMVAAGEQAIGMADSLRTNIPPAAQAARIKLEEVRRSALNIPDKTITELGVMEQTALSKIYSTRRALRDPELTKTRKAKLEAELRKWHEQLAQIKRDKELASRAIVVPASVAGVASRVRVTREKDKAGNVTGIIVGNVRGSVVQGRAAGGPVHGPGTSTSDSIPALVYARGGTVAAPAALSDDEHVMTAREVHGMGGHDAVYRMRKLAAAGKLHHAFAAGGAVQLAGPRADIRSGVGAATAAGMRAAVLSQIAVALAAEGGGGSFSAGLVGALNAARAQVGAPYNWAHQGPKSVGYDCSGYQSFITNVARGKRNPYTRVGATGSMPWAGFAAGPGAYSIGWLTGNPGHMAGTINGVNVESRGGDGVVVGPRARGARDPLFGGRIAHLQGFAGGGRVRGEPSPFGPKTLYGDPAFDLLAARGMYAHGRKPHTAMAGGGVIREPVMGVGASGRTYSFAERGPETVTPGAPLTAADVEEGFYRALRRSAADGNAVAMMLAELVAGPILDAAGVGSRR